MDLMGKDFSKYNYSELIIQLKGDSVEAFNEIYHRMLPKLYGFLTSLYNDQNLIEEVSQEVFVKIWENRKKISVDGSFEYFVYTIAKHRIYDHLKKYKRKLEVYAKLGYPHKTNSVEEKVHYHDLQNHIDNIINDLPESQKKIFVLSRQHYLSNKAIAQKLNISERTVENQIYKALRKMKKELSQNNVMLQVLILILLI